jgi:hypothetical protein
MSRSRAGSRMRALASRIGRRSVITARDRGVPAR